MTVPAPTEVLTSTPGPPASGCSGVARTGWWRGWPGDWPTGWESATSMCGRRLPPSPRCGASASSLYVVLWRLTLDVEDDRPPRVLDSRQRIGLALAFIGGLWHPHRSRPGGRRVRLRGRLHPVFGLAALWDRSESPSLARIILPDGGGGRSVVRLIGGLVLVIGGLGLLFSSVAAVSQIGFTLLAVAVTVAGLVLAFGPWMYRMAQDLGQERRERVRQEERAEVAAHLHDSVLQTLALIQRSEDPRKMASLARSQERELRGWLYGRAPVPGEDLLSTAFEGAVAKIEDERHVAIDLVKVGDATLDDRGRALVGPRPRR